MIDLSILQRSRKGCMIQLHEIGYFCCLASMAPIQVYGAKNEPLIWETLNKRKYSTFIGRPTIQFPPVHTFVDDLENYRD